MPSELQPSEATTSAPASVTVHVRQERLRRLLVPAVAFLIVATFAAQVMKDATTRLGTITRFFDSDEKLNLPTLYKELMLLSSALVIWVIARAAAESGDRWARHWRRLALVVALLALDEMVTGHQKLGELLDRHLDLSGPLHFSWVVVYLPAAAVAGLALAAFWWNLEPGLRRSLAAAGVLFGGGSGLVELVKGSLASSRGEDSLAFYLSAAFSDSLEMIGLAILLVCVLGELRRRTSSVRVVLDR